MRNDRIKMIRQATKNQKFQHLLTCDFERKFRINHLDAKNFNAIADKAFNAIKRHNIAAARTEQFDRIWHVRAYKVPRPKQLAEFDKAVAAFG